MPEETDTPAAAAKKRILIVEDERPLAHALELKMMHEGYDIHVASTGEDGLKEAMTGTYDLMLLDLILPGIDGFEILKSLQEQKIPIKIIILSNLGQDEDRKKAEEFGAAQYLVKSNVPLADIVKVIQTIL